MSLLGSKSAKADKSAKPDKKAAKAEKQAEKLAAKSAKKSAQAAKAAGKQKAPTAPTRGVAVEKPKANIYTVLLVLSLLAILVGCLCLYAEMRDYNFEIRARI